MQGGAVPCKACAVTDWLIMSPSVCVCVCVAGSKRVSVFVSRGATQILLHVLVCEYKDDECLSELLVAVHQLLAKLGPRGTFILLIHSSD